MRGNLLRLEPPATQKPLAIPVKVPAQWSDATRNQQGCMLKEFVRTEFELGCGGPTTVGRLQDIA